MYIASFFLVVFASFPNTLPLDVSEIVNSLSARCNQYLLSYEIREEVYDEIESYRRCNHTNTSVAFWVESSETGALFSNADEIWPTASTIKIFILIAAFMNFKDVWNQTPQELPQILNNEINYDEPLRMFSSSDRQEIKTCLWNMTFRELAESMMGRNQSNIGNAAYNASSNILIYLLGGPQECTTKIQTIHSAFNSVRIGRYMLEPRTEENDNRNSMRSSAAACRLIYENGINGLTEIEHNEIRDCFQKFNFHGLDNYQKHGHLSDAPSVNSWIGWFERNGAFYFYGVTVVSFDIASVTDKGADHYRDILMNYLYGLSSAFE